MKCKWEKWIDCKQVEGQPPNYCDDCPVNIANLKIEKESGLRR